MTTCHIDGFGPLPCVRPASVPELGEIIRQASAADGALYPVGGGTQLALGGTPTKAGQAVDITGLNRIVDFPARDMTVTVETGITIKELRETLARENLRLPIDVPQADLATLGGILAVNLSGPRRLGFGTLRDYLIGVSALNDEGREFKAGGRVVKNVAGYDLCKLLVGSLGTLGILTQATLKLVPLAEENALVSIGCEPARLDALLGQICASRTRPVCVDLFNRAAAGMVFAQAKLAAPDNAWTLVIGYEGNSDAVAWQVQQLVKEVAAQTPIDARVGFTAQPLWDALVDWDVGTPVAFKASMVPSAVPGFCQQVEAGAALHAHAESGIVRGVWNADLTKEEAGRILNLWRGLAPSVVVTRCPPDWKGPLSVWGPPPEAAWLMREIKAKFDPKRLFNPGRFVDGI